MDRMVLPGYSERGWSSQKCYCSTCWMEVCEFDVNFLLVRFSGSIAASAFSYFKSSRERADLNVKRVFILGPSHRYYSKFILFILLMCSECLLSCACSFESPLGRVNVDRECIEELLKTVVICKHD